MNKTLEQLIVDTIAKERNRNNPDRPSEHKFSSCCSCGLCHMAYLCAEAIRKWIKVKVADLRESDHDGLDFNDACDLINEEIKQCG